MALEHPRAGWEVNLISRIKASQMAEVAERACRVAREAQEAETAELKRERQAALDAEMADVNRRFIAQEAAVVDSERRSSCWREIYAAAIDGEKYVDLVDIDPSDLNYFKSVGLLLSLISTGGKADFRQEQKNADISSPRKIEDILCDESSDHEDYSNLIRWQFDTRPYSGHEGHFIDDGTGNLLKSLNQPDPRNFYSIHRINLLRYNDANYSCPGLTETSGFSVGAVRWLSSAEGQKSLGLICAEIKIAAECGVRCLYLTLVDNGKFTMIKFPSGATVGFYSAFDIRQVLSELGYGIEEAGSFAKTKMAVSW